MARGLAIPLGRATVLGMKRALMISALAAVAGVYLFSSSGGDDGDVAHVSWKNRIWIDVMPQSAKQKINAFVAVDDPRVGLFQKTSAYEGDFSLFAWRGGDGGKVEIEILQTEKRHRLRVETSSRDCGNFDHCMTVKGAPRGAKRYFSMDDWVVDSSAAGTPAALEELVRAKIAAAN